MIIGLGVCLGLLLAVVFVLPAVVDPVPTPKTAMAPPLDPQAAAAVRGPTESPWQDAQFAKARREAQTILEKLLERQEELEGIRADLWAAEDYAAAQQLAETADEHYRRQEFPQAQQYYKDSLQRFDELLQRSQAVFASALTAGQQAIVDGDAALAREQFQLASHIEPDSAEVETGLERATVLKDVLAEIDAGDRVRRNNELEDAKQHYQRALQLDAQSPLASRRLGEINGAIADRNFGENMSVGFAAMSDSNYPRAIDAFQRALDIKPDATDARNALTQAQNEKTQTTLQSLLTTARKQEQNEQWQAAAENYQQALEIDANLAEARAGSIRAGTRADIDKKLQAILASPQRLTTASVHREYQAFYQDMRRIKNVGPRLHEQLDQLEQALHIAVQPVTVQLISDEATEVILYRVGELGSFSETEVTLQPGTYTVVGTRKGYRDVRQEFTVSAGSTRSVTVQCVEKITQG